MKRSLLQLGCSAVLAVAFASASEAQAVGPSAQRMDEVVRYYADGPQPTFMGVVLVARGTDVLFAKAYGMANLEWSIPHTLSTKLAIGSNSKQVTAAAILLLEERGKLRVTDPIKSYLPDSPAAWDAITFHHLLSHTAGLIGTAPADRGNVLPARPERTIERFRNLPLQFAPGTSFSYSNAGYQLLAYLIERTSGQRYEDFVRQSIFEPLGMKESGSATHAPIIPSLASGYVKEPGGAFRHAPFIDLSNGMGAGSLYSTVGDLHRWTLGLFGGKLLRSDSLTKMTTPVSGGYAYGLGVATRLGRRQLSHGGGVSGFVSAVTYFPESQVTVVALSNLPSGESIEKQPPIIVLSEWLGILAHGETVNLPPRRSAPQ